MELSDSSFWSEFLRGMLKPAAATAVVAMAVGLSFMQKLGLEWEMVYSIARAFLQLSVIGFVLEFIFTQKNAGWIVLAYLFMVLVAGYTAGQRAKHVPRGNYIAGASILAGTSLTMLLLVVLNVFPFTPRYIIPVSGMMVGNAMTVTGVTMKKLREDVKIQKNLVETALALGATPRQATLHQVKRSLIIALSPVLDNAKTVGLISLPALCRLISAGQPSLPKLISWSTKYSIKTKGAFGAVSLESSIWDAAMKLECWMRSSIGGSEIFSLRDVVAPLLFLSK